MFMLAVLNVWNDSSQGRRIGIVVGLLVVLVLTGAGFVWLFNDPDEVLFSGLEARDAASVVRELERMKVEYQLAEGGTTILVPGKDVYHTRLKLMGTGMPLSGGVGFEIFDNSDFGMTEFAQRINLQRALEGELTRTIMALEEIKYARVHLVMPEGGLFKQSTREPSASVTLFLKQERHLDSNNILGIQRLVAAAVPGLSAQQVTVSDQDGATLSKVVGAETGVEAISQHLQKKSEVEHYLAGKAIAVLEKAFGSNQALVSVDVALDFSQTQTTREEVLSPTRGSGEGVLRRRESRAGNDADKNTTGKSSSTEVEYKLGREVAQTVEAPGQIRRISVGVIVPGETSDVRREEISHLVAMAVGLDESRGDAIGVYAAAAPTQAAMSKPPNAAPDAPPMTAAVGALNPMDVTVADGMAESGSEGYRSAWQAWFAQVWRDQPQGMLAMAVAMLLVLSLLLYALVRVLARGGVARRALTPEERERLLEQIQGWLELEPQGLAKESEGSRIGK